MAGRRIAGFLTDNDSNACHGVLRKSPKGATRWKRRRALQIFGVAFADEISLGAAPKRRPTRTHHFLAAGRTEE
jgi:hypothetical protein